MATILVVDDEPMLLKLCASMLSRAQHRVVSVASGEEALESLRDSAPDLALLDVMMPGMNGIDLASRIQQANPHTKILLMTGFGPSEIANAVGQTNPHRIIWKPFKTESLIQMIDNVLDERSS